MYFDCISYLSSSCSIIGKMQLLLCCNYMCWVEISTYSKICCLICLQYDLDTFPKTKYHHLQKFILTDTCNQYQVNIIIYQQYLLKQCWKLTYYQKIFFCIGWDFNPTNTMTVKQQLHFLCNTMAWWWLVDTVKTCSQPFCNKVLIYVVLDSPFLTDTEH